LNCGWRTQGQRGFSSGRTLLHFTLSASADSLRRRGLLLDDDMIKTTDGFAGRLDGKSFEQLGYRFERSVLIAEFVNLILVGNERCKARALG
jgi:hypothetical protein